MTLRIKTEQTTTPDNESMGVRDIKLSFATPSSGGGTVRCVTSDALSTLGGSAPNCACKAG